MPNAGLDEARAGIKIARRNINNLRYADDTTLWQKKKKIARKISITSDIQMTPLWHKVNKN